MPAAPGKAAVALALAALYLIWGSTYLGIRFALEGGWPPLLMAGVRFVLAGGLMYAVLRWRGVAAPTRAQWRTVTMMGLTLIVLGNGLVCIAEQTVSSGMTAVAVASSPLWMGVFSALRGHRPTRMEILGLAIGFAGVVWLSAGSGLGGSRLGMAALLGATLAWAFGSIWSRGRDLPSAFMGAAGQMLVGGAILLVVAFALGERMPAMPSTKGLLSVGYLVVFGSIVAYSAYNWLLDHVRPVLASSYGYVNPAIAVLLGAWLAAERFSGTQLAAMGVILLGVVAISLAKARAPEAEAAA
jgi:drug/metabolite transporter (DMT)-like permease